MKVNRTELADVFGVNVTTIDAWVRAGAPFEERATGKGKGWKFDTAEVARWRMRRAAEEAGGTEAQDETALRLRKLRAETEAVELELAKARVEVAPIAQFERAWSTVLAELQAQLRGALITRLVAQLIGETDPARFKRIALTEVDAALEVLADIDIAGFEDDDTDPAAIEGGSDGNSARGNSAH